MTKCTGSIFILVLSMLVILSFFTLSLGFTVRQRLQEVGRLEARDKLRLIAEAGVKKAVFVLNQNKNAYQTLAQSWSSNENDFREVPIGEGSFSVSYPLDHPVTNEAGKIRTEGYGMVDEERKINLNTTRSSITLANIFERAAEITREEAQAIAFSILDWRDPDDDPYDGGGESRYYESLKPPYTPKNGPFDSLEELLFVKGVTPEIYEKVRPYLTLTGNSKINVNTASPLVLRAIGFSDSLISKLMKYRKGHDEEEGTQDDGVFRDLTSAVEMLRISFFLSAEEVQNFTAMIEGGQIDVFSQHYEIFSIGQLKHSKQILKVRAIIDGQGGILSWQENFGLSPV